MELKVTKGHFKDKREAIREISDAGWWPVSTHGLMPGDKLELPAFTVHSAYAPKGATYIVGMPKVELVSDHALAPDA